MKIFRNLIVLLCFYIPSLMSWSQTTTFIRGTVIEQGTNEVLVGVNVYIKGTTNGVLTDTEGKYFIDNVKFGDTLVFSYIGMKTQEIIIKEQKIIDIVLVPYIEDLDEVVVIGYGTAKKRDLTGSIETINSEELANKPSSNPIASLQGKIAGVQVVNTGRPGQDPEVRIRGTNSINGYKPLYVVDGLFADNINYLNPEDIESIDILKDPSSLAIFGVRGANGVIIVTTKQAKKGQVRVNVNSSLGFKNITDKINLTNASQFRELYDEQLKNQGVNAFDYTGWDADTDWQDEIFQTGWQSNTNVSIAGATDKSKFYLGLGYISEEGSIRNEKMSKYTVNLNSEYNVTNNLKFGFKVNGIYSLPADAKGVSTALKAAPIAPVYNQENKLFHTMPDFQRAQVWNPMIGVEYLKNHTKGKNYRFAGNIYGELDFLKYFKFKTTFSADYFTGQTRSYHPLIQVYNPDVFSNKEYISETESVGQSKSNMFTAQSDYILTFTKSFSNHNLTLMTGLTTNYIEFSSLGGSRSQNIADIVFSIPNDNDDKWWISSIGPAGSTNSSGQFKKFTMSYLLRALYNYDRKYLLNASFRRDGSSVFSGIDNTWDNFYSFGVGWVVSQENFMASQNLIDYLKIKGSWGILGSQNTGGSVYPTYPILVNSGSAIFGDRIITGYSPSYLVQDLGWEKTHAWEIGAEIIMLNKHLSFTPVYYKKNTKDIIVSLSGFSGAKNSLENLGEIENKGWEFSLAWSNNVAKSDLKYTVSAYLSTIDNTVISLGRGEDDAIYAGPKEISRTVENYPVGYFYGYKVVGIYQNEADVANYYPNTLAKVKPGDLMFKDVNQDGKITQDDRTKIGNPTPDFTYGFALNINYQNFDLNIDMMGVYGNEIYRAWGESSYAQLNYLSNRLDRWNGEGTSNWEPILDPSRAINRENSDYFIEDGSFFRIRNIQLGYNISKTFIKKINAEKIRFFINIQNPKTWSNNTGYTPEIGGSALSFGIDSGSYPMPVITTLGFNVTF